ncbi:hypothetical protein CAOG_03458 [Capsaspora owczarzaki ATCC 30864]|uniref:Uncharacterized protein n=1 Tax=Capsaspora owczarzaki (strain ATCC 30864) TaxID=595528 RepID=A0A0D2VPQ8_CAPO3|nr:hypothetical protein CAOG_03458 [Capsaspora owczarzaki ATCC 30864]KJE92502.1 hypothetical protein CAOG_003458 [Capsaspora owczarzaki ATCC 30864]|eukprot:XP_004364297.2 hypothetical protein CAOG_03458 [Capsaspora owczarzaki ATCC 30864]
MRTAALLFAVAALFCAVDAASTGNMRRLSHDVLHFEPLSLGNAVMASHHSRSRRSAADTADATIPLEFEAYGRTFRVTLRPNTDMVKPSARVTIYSDAGTRVEPVDVSVAFKGSIQGHSSSAVYATVVESGDVVATMRDEDGEMYYIEPSHRHLREAHEFDHVIYRLSDVDLSAVDSDAESKAMSDLEDIMIRQGQTTRAQLDQAKTSRLRTFHEAAGIRRSNMRRSIGPAKYCNLHMVADFKFYEQYMGSPASQAPIMTKMMDLFNSEQAIYTDPDNVLIDPEVVNFYGFQIEHFSVFETATGVFAGAPSNEAVADYLNRFAGMDFSDVCLGTLFTHRDWSGTLGLAYVAYPTLTGTPGGICQARSGGKSTNAGLVTTLNFGSVVSAAVSQVTLAHEHGHNLGSPHDTSAACTPGGSNGNYIMYYAASDGSKVNNRKFSSCTKASVGAVLNDKGATCFEVASSGCGNRIVDPNEECDCGSTDVTSCHDYDPCCNTDCTLRTSAGATCSPFKTPCCDANTCSNPGNTAVVCNATTDGCQTPGHCDSAYPNSCHPREDEDDDVLCLCDGNGANCNGMCQSGACTKSRCEEFPAGYNGTECTSATEQCKIFCWNLSGTACIEFEIEVFRDTSYTCVFTDDGESSAGYCDGAGACKESNHDASLKNALSKALNNIKDWIVNNWYVVMAIVIAIVFLVVMARWYFSRKDRASANNDMPMKERSGSDAQASRKREARQNIKRMFPAVENEVLESALRNVGYDVQAAAAQLRQMGYQ